MSTEINVRVDRELLLQRDRVQRQAQRQFVLEKNGQKLIVNRSQEQVAASGATGGENRIRSLRTSTQRGGQSVPTSPVTAPLERKPLPQLGGAASGDRTPNNGSYLALPQPPQLLNYTLNDPNFQQHNQGEPLYGHPIQSGKKIKPYYSVYLSDDGNFAQAMKPIPVANGAWTQADTDGLRYAVFFRPEDNLANERIGRYTPPTPSLATFTYETIFQFQDGYPCFNNIYATNSYFTLTALRLNFTNSGDPYENGSGLGVSVKYNGSNINAFGVGSTGAGQSYLSPSFASAPVHCAVTLSSGVLRLYVGGQLMASALLTDLIGVAQIPTDDKTGFGGELVNPFSVNDNLYVTSSITNRNPLAKTNVYCIRHTEGKALYTGSSFTPPTSITRLA